VSCTVPGFHVKYPTAHGFARARRFLCADVITEDPPGEFQRYGSQLKRETF
jgi:hypothetical protein